MELDHNKAQHRYYLKNREAIIQKQKEYNEKNKDKIKEYFKQYYDDNREYFLTRSKERERSEYFKQRYEANKEKAKEYVKKWRAEKKRIKDELKALEPKEEPTIENLYIIQDIPKPKIKVVVEPPKPFVDFIETDKGLTLIW